MGINNHKPPANDHKLPVNDHKRQQTSGKLTQTTNKQTRTISKRPQWATLAHQTKKADVSFLLPTPGNYKEQPDF